MCNLYSITTNQAAIIALFRVINRYVGNLPTMAGRVSRLSRTGDPQHQHWSRVGGDAVEHAATAGNWRTASYQYPQYVLTALARSAQARKPVPSFHLLCVRAIGRCGVE